MTEIDEIMRLQKEITKLEQRNTLLEAEKVSLKQQLENAIEDTQLNIGDWNKPL